MLDRLRGWVGETIDRLKGMEMREAPLLEYLEKWQLELEGATQQSFSGTISFVRRGSRSLVLKIPRLGQPNGWDALRHFAGSGAVHAIDHHPGGAILLERAIPGQPLQEWAHGDRDDEAMRVLCRVAAALHSRPCPTQGFERVDGHFAYFDRIAADSVLCSPELLQRVRGLFLELSASQCDERLCHADLHHGNIVYDQKRGWLAIDPHGVIAEPAFEIAAALRNPTDLPPWIITSSIVDRRVGIASEHLGLDRDRICGWAFCTSVWLAAWAEKRVKKGIDPQGFLAVAEAVRPFLP